MEDLARNWTTIIYFEELGGVKVVQDALRTLHYSCLISPVHNPDEESKKKHIHILLKGEKKSKKQIIDLLSTITNIDKDTGSLSGIAKPQTVKNLRSMVRYFLHLDDVDKEQFEEKKMIAFDFDYEKYLVDTSSKSALKDIIKLIKEYKCCSLIDLLSLCIENEIDYTYIEKHTYLINTIIKDFNYEKNNIKVKNLLTK